MQKITRTLSLAGLLVLSLVLAACSDNNEDPQATPPPTVQQPPAKPEPLAEVMNLSGVDTSVALDAGFVEALESLELTPGAVGDGEITEEGDAVFPITGGEFQYFEPGTVTPFVKGNIVHDGSGLSLTKGDLEVELTDFVVDPGASVLTGTVSANGEVAAEDAPLFFLDGGTLEPLETDEEAGTATLSGTTVELKAEAAELLNQTFETEALEEGLLVGVATITINTTPESSTPKTEELPPSE